MGERPERSRRPAHILVRSRQWKRSDRPGDRWERSALDQSFMRSKLRSDREERASFHLRIAQLAARRRTFLRLRPASGRTHHQRGSRRIEMFLRDLTLPWHHARAKKLIRQKTDSPGRTSRPLTAGFLPVFYFVIFQLCPLPSASPGQTLFPEFYRRRIRIDLRFTIGPNKRASSQPSVAIAVGHLIHVPLRMAEHAHRRPLQVERGPQPSWNDVLTFIRQLAPQLVPISHRGLETFRGMPRELFAELHFAARHRHLISARQHPQISKLLERARPFHLRSDSLPKCAVCPV